jgi:hypothetical protein
MRFVYPVRFYLDYSRVEANPPHPNNKVEASAHEDVVLHFEWAAAKQMWRDQLAESKKCR